MATMCADAGLHIPPPQAAFYLYPDFGPWRVHLLSRHGVSTSTALARLLVQRYGAVTLPGTAFGDRPSTLTLRLATARIYGKCADQQQGALDAANPLTHPPIATALARLTEILADLTS
jgi:aspartate aminotransferase